MAQERSYARGVGAIYDFYIERPVLARLSLGAMLGSRSACRRSPRRASLSRGRRKRLEDARKITVPAMSPAAAGPDCRFAGDASNFKHS